VYTSHNLSKIVGVFTYAHFFMRGAIKCFMLVILGATVRQVYADESLALARSHNCMSCHTIDKKFLGPAFTTINTRYHGEKNAEETLIKAITHGSSGQWGVLKMPANSNITPKESKQLAAWILQMPVTKPATPPKEKTKK
jgi:cytochrome c